MDCFDVLTDEFFSLVFNKRSDSGVDIVDDTEIVIVTRDSEDAGVGIGSKSIGFKINVVSSYPLLVHCKFFKNDCTFFLIV